MQTRIYLGKINGINRQELYQFLQSLGEIQDFMAKETYAFVEYTNEHDTKRALIELDGRVFTGQRIVAEIAQHKNNALAGDRIYIGRLNHYVQKSDILEQFSRFGEIKDCLRKDDYAFIEYSDSSQAADAIRQMHNYSINGCKIIVEAAKIKSDKLIKSPRLYIGKLGAQVKKQDLINAFGQFGEIIDILMKDEYAFIEYSSNIASNKAFVELNGARIQGSKIQVEEARVKEGQEFQKKAPLSQKDINSLNFKTELDGLSFKPKGRRLSPKRSLSRSRSRSKDRITKKQLMKMK